MTQCPLFLIITILQTVHTVGKYNVKLATLVEGAPKFPFSIARVGEGATPSPGLLLFTLDLYLIMLSVKPGGTKYHFRVSGMSRPGIEPRSPEPLANTQTIMPILTNNYPKI